jgi:2-dehydro-3-deoxyphosphooctonate aldolase (KDO 8-P synthase)
MHTTIRDIEIGKKRPLAVIAGPCVIESAQLCLTVAKSLKATCKRLGLPLIFKASFDKANRNSLESFRGPGIEHGLSILADIGKRTGLPVLSDVHEVDQVDYAAEVLDVLQVPAFLCRQTDLVVACAESGRAVNIKKGQFMAPQDMHPIVGKTRAANRRCPILLTERGTTFGYHNLVVDPRSIEVMRDYAPVVFDATHSVQRPGAGGGKSGGDRGFVPVLARAAVAAGADAVFLEVHPDPDRAQCDGPNMMPLKRVGRLLKDLKAIRETVMGMV